MNLQKALQRIEELEARVRALETAPKQETHFHYHQPDPTRYSAPWNPLTPYCHPWGQTSYAEGNPTLSAYQGRVGNMCMGGQHFIPTQG